MIVPTGGSMHMRKGGEGSGCPPEHTQKAWQMQGNEMMQIDRLYLTKTIHVCLPCSEQALFFPPV